MLRRKKCCVSVLCATAVTACLAVAVPAGPLPGAVQAPAARAMARGPEISGRPQVVAADPQKAAALGLPGLAAGDAVEVARPSSDVWTITDPKSGHTVESRREPDLAP